MTSERPTADRHVPVMLERVLDLMAPGLEAARAAGRTPVALDGTLGMGGHTEAILRRHPDTIVVGIDRDTQALRLATERLSWAGDRLRTWHGTYDEVSEALADAGVEGVDAALYDLGVSSYQLDERERGFAYSYDAPLDMRMDPTAELTAETVVNTYPEAELRRIIRSWGEEKFAGRIAAAIVRSRAEEAFSSTGRLVEVIRGAVPAAAGKSGGHPAKRTFQALRIEVNEELDVLERALPEVMSRLNVGGRLVVMSYHSLEDRITKGQMTALATSTAPPGFPIELEEHAPVVKMLTRGVDKPTQHEIEENPRASSAKVRALEKIRTSPRSSA
ncbi:16S rRNA (cytosine(1402)-N(4))-methyltransferase RsmH [Micrococcus terreus]|uniref:16S rRNA (cytosine(1402)-N(4))-methyltransferase RsmH n=1 Tax=Micrococcus terreus TaxID=574650 RepID=UPI0023F6B0D0|nr:16S rRNA (cytosine(1402)-N(4))-methyltransferase RsmH [Micrococcus terreus]MDK7702217.1 16S rRNA (cytosine(1402)-N(4))-methyltransferase RsmH [Micrococcus terreus]WOO98521.1 16S rRNA (cytosine(1402)-N(4))-methyltransferase RsmH [Micrococcus terreus]